MHKRITNYLKAGYTGLYVLSHEEHRATADIVKACNAAGRHCYAWDVITGYVPLNETAQKLQGGKGDLFAPFNIIHTADAVVIIRDIQLLLANATGADAMGYLRTMINGLYLGLGGGEGQYAVTYVIVAPSVKLPAELEKDFQVVEFELPDREELGEVVRQIATSAKQSISDIEPLVDACSGLTSKEASDALSLSFVETGTLSPRVVAREKAATLKKNGLLEVVESNVNIEDIGGLGDLKEWLKNNRKAFTKKARAWLKPSARPKGVLMLGIPGCGKSLVSKATSSILGVPLLKLDAGKLFGSLVGQSEANVRAVIQTAEAIAPCVLWIDELEKGFGSQGGLDGGTSDRVLGSLLQWMQEKTKDVFIVATANDVSKLKPEFLRKGRFDEQWFVDLPNVAERGDIWRVVARKNEWADLLSAAEIKELVALTDGFSGAEIEAVFIESLKAAMHEDGGRPETVPLKTFKLSIERTVPLSKMMSTQISALREWCKDRARPATAPERAIVPTGPAGRKLAS